MAPLVSNRRCCVSRSVAATRERDDYCTSPTSHRILATQLKLWAQNEAKDSVRGGGYNVLNQPMVTPHLGTTARCEDEEGGEPAAGLNLRHPRRLHPGKGCDGFR